MKKTLLFLTAAAFSVCVFVTHGCSINDDLSNPSQVKQDVSINKADMVVASRSYTDYTKTIKAVSKEFGSAFTKLSKEDREQILSLFTQGERNSGIDVLSEASQILNYDLKASHTKILRKHKAIDFSGVSLDDLARAIYRTKRNWISSRTNSEENPSLVELCLADCMSKYEYNMAVCKYNYEKTLDEHECTDECICQEYDLIHLGSSCECLDDAYYDNYYCEEAAFSGYWGCCFFCMEFQASGK